MGILTNTTCRFDMIKISHNRNRLHPYTQCQKLRLAIGQVLTGKSAHLKKIDDELRHELVLLNQQLRRTSTAIAAQALVNQDETIADRELGKVIELFDELIERDIISLND
jgi:uncharacterized membrane protein YccC